MFYSLKLKIAAAFLFVALVPLLVAMIVSFFVGRDAIVKQNINQLEIIVDLKIEKIEIFLKTLKEDIGAVQNFSDIKSYLRMHSEGETENDEFEDLHRHVNEHMQAVKQSKGFIDVLIFNRDGLLVFTTEDRHLASELGKPFSGELHSHILAAMNEKVTSDVFKSTFAPSGFEMLVSGPIRSEDGRTMGVLTYAVDMGPVYESIQDTTGLGRTGETLLGIQMNAHKEKVVGGHTSVSDLEHVLFISKLKYIPDAAFSHEVEYGEKVALPMQEATRGIESSGISIDYRGEEVVAAWRYIPDLNWGVVAKIDTSEAFGTISNMGKVLLALSALLGVVIGLLAYLYSRSITKPIAQIARSVSVIGKGDYSVRVNINRKDEIGRLANSFNKMADNLDRARKDLSSKIEELEKFNTVTVGRELKMVELKQQIRELEEKIASEEEAVRKGEDNNEQ